MRSLDPQKYRNHIELLQSGGVAAYCELLFIDELTFVAADERTGETLRELKEGGESMTVTDDNIEEYIALYCEDYLCGEVREQLAVFLRSFWEICPLEALQQSGVTERDLALLICGVGTLDVDDWRRHTRLERPAPSGGGGSSSGGSGDSGGGVGVRLRRSTSRQRGRSPGPAAAPTTAEQGSDVDERFWAVLESLSDEHKAKLLQFCTGLSRLPPGGFGSLQPAFTLTVLGDAALASGQLPTSHTCVNQLQLPPFETEEQMRSKLMLAVDCGGGNNDLGEGAEGWTASLFG